MDANQILLWNNSWWGMKLTYQDDEILSSPTDGKMESFTALMHSVFVRTSSWFCCLPYNKHDVNFPNARPSCLSRAKGCEAMFFDTRTKKSH